MKGEDYVKASIARGGGLLASVMVVAVCGGMLGCSGPASTGTEGGDTSTGVQEAADYGDATSQRISEDGKIDMDPDPDTYEEKFPEAGDAKLSNAFAFILEGIPYQLDCDVQDLLDNGWSSEFPEYEGMSAAQYYGEPDTDVDSMTYALVSLFKDKKRIDVRAVNVSDDPKPWQECQCGGLIVTLGRIAHHEGYFSLSDEATGFETPSFATNDGLTLGMNAADVLDLYGKPYSKTYRTADDKRFISELEYRAHMVTSGISIHMDGNMSGSDAEIEIDFAQEGASEIALWYPFGLK